jgi:hypothetical protein
MANAIYNPTNIGDALYSAGDCGNALVYTGSAVITANLATTDKVRLVRIPGGMKIHRVVIKNPDLDSGTTLAINIGFSHADGSSGPSATAVASAATTWQSAATTTYELLPPVSLDKDGYLEIVPTAGGVGTGTVYGKVEGEVVGIK